MRRLITLFALSGTVTFLLVWLMASLLSEPKRDPGKYVWRYPETVNDIQVRKSLSGGALPRRKECTPEFIDKYRERVLTMGSCAVSSDCLHVNHGYLSMLAINKEYESELSSIVKKVDSVCGRRASHDGFYSDFGLKIECSEPENQCIVRNITYDEALDSMLEEFLKGDE